MDREAARRLTWNFRLVADERTRYRRNVAIGCDHQLPALFVDHAVVTPAHSRIRWSITILPPSGRLYHIRCAGPKRRARRRPARRAWRPAAIARRSWFEGKAEGFGAAVEEFEVVAAGAGGDLAYIVALEHTTVSLNGKPPQPYVLRATTVFRGRTASGRWSTDTRTRPRQMRLQDDWHRPRTGGRPPWLGGTPNIRRYSRLKLRGAVVVHCEIPATSLGSATSRDRASYRPICF
jgi:hypothetical protein